MMRTTAPKSATTPIPVQRSAPEFEAFLFPHLSMPKRDPKCTLGYHRVFHLILWLLDTPTVCPSVASRNLLLYQSLPSNSLVSTCHFVEAKR
jgi:hypothetical protein